MALVSILSVGLPKLAVAEDTTTVTWPGVFDDAPQGKDITDDYALNMETDSTGGGAGKGWMLSGAAARDGNAIQLTSNSPGQKGQTWNLKKLGGGAFHLRFWFETSSNSETEVGKGLAWFFTENAEPSGLLYGSNEKFKGLMIGFDSFDDDLSKDNPIIMAWVNNGTGVFSHDTDGKGTRQAGCRAKYRNRKLPVGVDIIYHRVPGTDGGISSNLRVRLHMGGQRGWEICMVKEDLDLPYEGFFGFTAANKLDNAGDNVKLAGLKVWDLRAAEEEAERAAAKALEEAQKDADAPTKETHELVLMTVEKGKALQDRLLDNIMAAVNRHRQFFIAEFGEMHRKLNDALDRISIVPAQVEEIRLLLDDVKGLQDKQEALQKEIVEVAGGGGSDDKDSLQNRVKKTAEAISELQHMLGKQEEQEREQKGHLRDHRKVLLKVLDSPNEQGWGTTAYHGLCICQVIFLIVLFWSKSSGKGASSPGSGSPTSSQAFGSSSFGRASSFGSDTPYGGLGGGGGSPQSPYGNNPYGGI